MFSPPDRLYLYNRHHTPLCLQLNKRLHKNAATTPIRVEPNIPIDVCKYLSLPKAEARRVLESSPDYQKFRMKLMVDLTDPEETDESKEAKQKRAVAALKEIADPQVVNDLLYPLPSPLSGKAHAPLPRPAPLPVPPVFTAKMDLGTTRKEDLIANDAGSFDDAKDVEAGQTGQTGQTGQKDPLSGDMKSVIADNIPSSKWSKEKLLEYARGKGLDMPNDSSKNAILRKLRGL